MPPKPVSQALSKSPLKTPLPHSIPRQEASPEHMQNIVWEENLVLSRETYFGHLKNSMANHHVPLECAPLNKMKMPLILIPCQGYSSLHTPDFSGLQAIKVISIFTCKDGLCRGPLRPGSPIALGAAQTPPKPEKSSQPYETPHKHPPDNPDVGNKILQYLCGHLFPAIF